MLLNLLNQTRGRAIAAVLATFCAISAAPHAQVSSISADYLRKSDLIVIASIAKSLPVFAGNVMLVLDEKEVLAGERRTRDPIAVFVPATHGYIVGDKQFVFFLMRQGSGDRTKMLESFGLPETEDADQSGAERLVALRELIAFEFSDGALPERLDAIKERHLENLSATERWSRWNAVRELSWMVLHHPDAFKEKDVAILDAGTDAATEGELRRVAARLANDVRRALLIVIPPDRLLAERSPGGAGLARRTAPASGADGASASPRRVVKPVAVPDESSFDYGDLEDGEEGFASLLAGTAAERRTRSAPLPDATATPRLARVIPEAESESDSAAAPDAASKRNPSKAAKNRGEGNWWEYDVTEVADDFGVDPKATPIAAAAKDPAENAADVAAEDVDPDLAFYLDPPESGDAGAASARAKSGDDQSTGELTEERSPKAPASDPEEGLWWLADEGDTSTLAATRLLGSRPAPDAPAATKPIDAQGEAQDEERADESSDAPAMSAPPRRAPGEIPEWDESEFDYNPPPETAAPSPAATEIFTVESFLDRYIEAPQDGQKAALIAGLADRPASAYASEDLAQILKMALSEPSTKIQTAALEIYEKFGSAEATPSVLELARNANGPMVVRLEAVRALGRQRATNAVGIIEALVDSDYLTEESLTALRRIDSPESRAALARLHERAAQRTGMGARQARQIQKKIEFLQSPAFEESERKLDRARQRSDRR